jgi:hypothetical protein
VNGIRTGIKHSFDSEWLYLTAASRFGCRAKIFAKFASSSQSSKPVSFKQQMALESQSKTPSDASDFKHFTLGEGSSRVKLHRLDNVIHSMLNDDK